MKKILFTFVVIFLVCEGAFCFPFKTANLYPINDEKGGGYINKDGAIALKQEYNFAFRFSGDFAIIQGKNLKYGVINKFGDIVLDFKYDELDNLNENFVAYKKGNKWGFIDIKKNIEYKAEFDRVRKFQEELAAIKVDNKWGFINKKNEIVIEPKYYDVSSFAEGLAAFSNSYHKTDGYINKKGKVIISFKDNNLEPKEFKEGLAPIISGADSACSYINKRGKVVLDSEKLKPIKSYCGNFYEGLRVFYIDDNPRETTTGFINKKGKIKYSETFSIPSNVSEGEFSAFDDFSSNMAQYTIDYKTGYINKKFRQIIPPIYEFARDFIGDLAYVKSEDKEGYINKKGKWVWSKKREGM